MTRRKRESQPWAGTGVLVRGWPLGRGQVGLLFVCVTGAYRLVVPVEDVEVQLRRLCVWARRRQVSVDIRLEERVRDG